MRVIFIAVLCAALQGCGVGAFYCLEKQKPSTLCDMW